MTELEKIFLTSGLTILGGVIVYVMGQFTSKFLLEPIYEQKKAIGKVINFLIFYANIYSSPRKIDPGDAVPKITEEAAVELRKVATELMARSVVIPFYRIFEILHLIISKEDIVDAHRSLIGLSNSVISGNSKENREFRKSIIKALGCEEIFRPPKN